MGRDYCGIDISEDYVKNTKIRLGELSKNQRKNLFGELNMTEYFELKRLFVEMGIAAETLIKDDKMFGYFLNQYRLRLNRDKPHDAVLIKEALKEFLVWAVGK